MHLLSGRPLVARPPGLCVGRVALSLTVMLFILSAFVSGSVDLHNRLAVPLPNVASFTKTLITDVRQKDMVNKNEIIAKDPYGKLLNTKDQLDVGFVHAFVASISIIIVSELGDKTFFIAAIMAMRHPRLTVFLGAISALGLMTFLAAVLGYATTVIPRWLTYYASSALFAGFGIKMLREGWVMSADEGQEEYEEVKEDLRRKDEEMEKACDLETGMARGPAKPFVYTLVSRVFLQSLTLTFLAEWGDRSQIATIILAARENVTGVILGGTLGHALCTGLAVVGGRFIAQRISIRTVTLIGGVVFIIFAMSAFFIDPGTEI